LHHGVRSIHQQLHCGPVSLLHTAVKIRRDVDSHADLSLAHQVFKLISIADLRDNLNDLGFRHIHDHLA